MAQNVDTQLLKAERIFSVEGWVCLVTGGGTGIGLMCAQALAANGARVYIAGRRKHVLDSAAVAHSPHDGPGQIIPIGPCDVTSKADLEKLCKELESREDHLNVLVCNAGISGPKAVPDLSDATQLRARLWEKEEPSEWDGVFRTNVTSVYFTTVAFLPLLQAASTRPAQQQQHATASGSPRHLWMGANVIVISSMSGLMRGSQGHFSYNAAKGATVHLTKLMATEFDKTGIRVNSIAPGYFPSEMTMSDSDARGKSYLSDDIVQGKGHPIPAARAGSDEEMAQACLFLAKNRYVNGEILVVDGGVLTQVPGR
ncbi:hypothetical protein B0T26DRAFT_737717 [Lasiosphaeria miniovina]|uniref:Uncharacterized protein n=1 Tax=Lasiosphaeria miniovina TaxID=1954250 RepID=A0AA40E6G6_9PEZI|nr:uncharacterized protein B0T26DRAFT_737717 [Lasiosphaeria miniovina]KAK0726817.1 hypothetical protein B0T26DRAFT_737717 [Lasiosphaeria miniovina]